MKVVFPLLALLTFAFQASAQYQGHVVFRTLFNSSVGNTLAQPFEGTATLVQTVTANVSSTLVTLRLRGLQANRSYGVHVHQWGDLSGALTTKMPGMTVKINTTLPTVPTVGTHFDVQGRGPWAHNCPPNADRHTGALGNITVAAGADPTVFINHEISSELLDLGLDALNGNSIIGRAVVIHENPDPCAMTNLGNWIAVGVIGIDNDASNKASQDALIPLDPWTFSPKANAVIYEGANVVGNVWFWTGLDNKTHMSGFVNGFTPKSERAVVIHQYGDVDEYGDVDGNSIGGIFQGPSTQHKLPPNTDRHWGILGNLKSNDQGTIIFNDITTGLELISLYNVSGHSIIGRSIAFHDEAETGSDGSMGNTLKYGVVGLAAPNAIVPTFEPNPNSAPAKAHAVIRAYYKSSIANTDAPFKGTVDFEQMYGGNVTVTLRVSGLQANKSYSVHVHQWGDLSAAIDPQTRTFHTTMATATSVGGHFDALGRGPEAHGCKGKNATRHTGDVGDLYIPADATPTTVTTFVLESELLDLGLRSDFANDSIIGRAVVIHEIPDLCYLPTPTALGPWIGVGVIGLLNFSGNSARQDTLPENTKANVLVLNADTKAPVGDIQLSTDAGVIRATGFVGGFVPNTLHGMHVHVWGNEDDALSSGPHYSQFLNDFGHGLPPSPTRHWGALGNVTANEKGFIIFNNVPINAEFLSLWNPAAHGIIGRILTFHQNADNGDPTSYGKRLFYGVIGLAKSDTPAPAIPADAVPTTPSGTTAPPTSTSTTAPPSGTGTTAPPTSTTTGSPATTGTPTPTPTPTNNGSTTPTPTPPTPVSTPAPTNPPSAATLNQVNALIMLIAIICASICVVA